MKYLHILIIFLGFNVSIQAQAPYFPQRNLETQNWHYLDVNGKTVLNITLSGIEDLSPFSEGLAAARDLKTHLWGYIDTTGKWNIKPAFEFAYRFKDGYAIVLNICKENCNTNEEGILYDYIGSVINSKGEIIFNDQSQKEDRFGRYFLDQNLGAGLFSVIFGIGDRDRKNVVNLKDQLLCDTYSVFAGHGDVIFDNEINAYRCDNRYYNLDGKMVLDLSKYTYVQPYTNGYTWVEAEIGKTAVSYNLLMDKKGKEIARFEGNLFNTPGPVIDGSFTYLDENSNAYLYNLKTKEKTATQLLEIEQDTQFMIADREKNGCRLFYAAGDEMGPLRGFISAKGEVFYKN